MGQGENTLVFYIWGDNGSSGKGQNGTISELLARMNSHHHHHHAHRRPRPARRLGRAGLPEDREPLPRWMAWAGSTPYKWMKLLASHLGGTRNPLAVRWPARIAADHHPGNTSCIATTSSRPSRRSRNPAAAPGQRCAARPLSTAPPSPPPSPTHRGRRQEAQYFEVMGGRAIYHDGWMASAFGPRVPWTPGLPPGIADWAPTTHGSSTTSPGLVAKPRPCPRETRKLAELRELFARVVVALIQVALIQDSNPTGVSAPTLAAHWATVIVLSKPAPRADHGDRAGCALRHPLIKPRA